MSPRPLRPEEEPDSDETKPLSLVGIELPGLKARLTPDDVDKLVNFAAKWFLMGITVMFITWKVFDCGEAEPPCENCGQNKHGAPAAMPQPPEKKP